MTRKISDAERAIAAHITDCSICKGSSRVEVGSDSGFQISGLCKTGLTLAPETIILEVNKSNVERRK